MQPIQQDRVYNEDRVWATLHLDRLTAHQVGVAACFMLLSPDSKLTNTTLHCASIVSGETYSDRPGIMERLPLGSDQANYDMAGGWHDWRTINAVGSSIRLTAASAS